jgi:hypothetical protein
MAEKTLNVQLNGAEIVEAVVDAIRQKMTTDCFLNPNSAYDWFSAEVRVKLDMHDTGAHVKGDYSATTIAGAEPNGEVATADATFEIEPAPPNEVRVASGQAVPTLTRDGDGKPVIKGVRYARKDAQKAK